MEFIPILTVVSRGTGSGTHDTLFAFDFTLYTVEKLAMFAFLTLAKHNKSKIKIKGKEINCFEYELINDDSYYFTPYMIFKGIIELKQNSLEDKDLLYKKAIESGNQEITYSLDDVIETGVTPIYDKLKYCEQNLTLLPQIQFSESIIPIVNLTGYCEQNLTLLPQIQFSEIIISIVILTGYCEQNLTLL